MESVKDESIAIEEIEAKLKELQQWINDDPEMPKKFEAILLLHYLKVARWRVEKAQTMIKLSLQLRTEHPEIFTDRDPLKKEMKDVFKATDMVLLSTTTEENYKIGVFRLLQDELDHIEFNDLIKAFFVMSDVRNIMFEPKLNDGEIIIFDMSQVSYHHVTKIVLSTLRLYLRYIQEAHPVKVRQIHIINCNPIIDKLMMLIKPFLSTRNYQMINCHTAGSETLFDFVPRELLPNELGGNHGPITEIKGFWLKQMEKHRDYIMDDDAWRLNIEQNNNSDEKEGGGVLDFLGIF
ncbi:hypothetical protein PVAND_009985 [Polypedilum vanderplanki]|uniref:CRAL-TRIO domain-containing protein n=1 Tax=Polypedilum vanderplanki TaxID=319348 RepID=A0A9J6CEW2_POLVA|nr:hypothetical protein PVAND_009985 [Polypedilum vanderplanki]